METNRENMIAIHRISPHKMEKVCKRGAFICPSVAYTKRNDEHIAGAEAYGDIYIVFDEGSIDPEICSDNHIYSTNGYTQMVSATEKRDDLSIEEFVRIVKENQTFDSWFV